jgi:hypothetical protein
VSRATPIKPRKGASGNCRNRSATAILAWLPDGSTSQKWLDHVDAQQVTGAGLAHRDGTGHHVRSVVDLAMRAVCGDGDHVGEHLGLVHTEVAEKSDRIAALILEDALVADRVDGDGVAARDLHHGCRGGVGQPTPVHLVGP